MPVTTRVKTPQHVVKHDKAVWQDDALDRRMRDIALVPQGVVLEGCARVGADEPRKADDLFAPNRVAFVRHRRGALLSFGERLLDLADFSLLEPPNLQCELFEGRGRDRERCEKLGVTVPLDHLRCDGGRLETERSADIGLDRRRQVRERADGPRELAHRHGVARAVNAPHTPRELRVPQRQLQPERHRLGMDAVRPPDHGRVPVLLGAGPNRPLEAAETAQDQVAGVPHLQRLRCVDDVRRS